VMAAELKHPGINPSRLAEKRDVVGCP